MKTIHPNQIEMALFPQGTRTFASVIRDIEADHDLDDVRKRDLISGLRRVAKALGRPPEEMLAEPRWLQVRLVQVAPAALGLTEKSWQNVVSDARAALARVGIVKRRLRYMDQLQGGWLELWQAVLGSGNHTLIAGLGRFIHFLSNLGLAPTEVTQAHANAFLDGLRKEEIAKNPDASWRYAINAWNRATSLIDPWPKLVLTVPKRRTTVKLADDALPAALLLDLDEQMRRAMHPDPFLDDVAMRPLAPSTAKQRTNMLKRFASELLIDGVPPEEISSVSALCAPVMAKRGLQAMFARNGNRKGAVIADMANILVACARRLELDDKAIAALRDLSKRAAMPSQRGMTKKNRDRLRVLRDEAVLRRLLTLPDMLFRKGGKQHDKAAALAKEDALAIGILLVCPLRIGNISAIDIDRHLQRPGDGRLFLVLEEGEVKNRQPIEFEVPPDLRRMIDQHLANRSPLLCPPGTRWLFPRRDGTGPVDTSTLSTRLKKRILDETGIVMNAHLFRHLAAMVWLDANPGGYEAARRLLGHAATSHTISVYSGLEARSAVEAFGQVLDQKRRK
ncbi:site-specific integrase [Tabrizicola sp. J26]|uniref:site-specific integrase n=1 Tax=Alitabrizicola rongguiensis TaxID=2909234 RepID=UPI001F3FA4E3|nr:site-specific integrase [Tabrizicola rongguiensis]MCF1711069.1 site-specific integrase [Tabrizicola rongguiensis]